jgi:HEAT repeat protein
MNLTRPALLVALLVLPSLPAAGRADEAAEADERLLREAGVGTDGAALLAFFRGRTLTDADRRRVEEMVRHLGSDVYEEREQATRGLIRRGPPALPFLRRAADDPDPEARRRARRCLEEIEAGPGAALPTAAARVLARKPAPGTAAALLAYLPFAEPGVEDDVFAALLAAGTEEGKADRAWAAALVGPLPVLREAAGHVLGAKGDKAQREAVRKLLADREPRVRLRAAQGLLTGGDRSALPALAELLNEAPADLAWQAEETLRRLAGDKAPAPSLGDGSAAARRRCRDAWAAWCKAEGARADLARLTQAERLLGLTLGVEYNTGRVWECGPDGKLRWELTGLAGPMEAQVLPGGRVLVVESNNNTLSERDFKGKVLWEKKLHWSPTGCRRLPNGNTFVSHYGGVLELDRAGHVVYQFNLPDGGANAIARHRNGHVIYARDNEIVEVDTTGKKVRAVPLPPHSMYVGIQGLPGDRFLVANSSSGRVLELDNKGKILWEANVPGACGVSRLPNGHTLVSASHLVAELDRAGKKVWEKRRDGYVRRAHRR